MQKSIKIAGNKINKGLECQGIHINMENNNLFKYMQHC